MVDAQSAPLDQFGDDVAKAHAATVAANRELERAANQKGCAIA